MDYRDRNRTKELLDKFDRAGSAKRKIALLYAMVNDNEITLTEFSHLVRIVDYDRQYEECTNEHQTQRRQVPIRS